MGFEAILKIDTEERRLLSFSNCYFHTNPTSVLEPGYSSFNTIDDVARSARTNRYSYRPKGDPYGGLFEIVMESTDDDECFYHWLRTTQALNGCIEIVDEKDTDSVIRRIEFWDAWVTRVSERMSSTGSSPMVLACRISPAIIRQNKGTIFKKSWYITDLDGGNYAASDDGEKGSITINRAYWIDEDEEQIERLMTDEAVTLYVEFVGDYSDGQSVELIFEDEDDNGWKKIANCKGTINGDGIMTIPDFKLEYELEMEETNND